MRSLLLPVMNVPVLAEIYAAASAAIHPDFVVIDHPPCQGVSYVTKLLHLEPHPPRASFVVVRELFEGGVNRARTRSAGRNRENTK